MRTITLSPVKLEVARYTREGVVLFATRNAHRRMSKYLHSRSRSGDGASIENRAISHPCVTARAQHHRFVTRRSASD